MAAKPGYGTFRGRRQIRRIEKTKGKAQGQRKIQEARADAKAATIRAKGENKATKKSKAIHKRQREVAELQHKHQTAQTIAKGTAASTVAGTYSVGKQKQAEADSIRYQAYLDTLNQPLSITTGGYEGTL